MGESHARIEGGWNPGEVWPVPVECLLNGMTTTDAHLMFGGGHMFPPHFRHRFQPPVHLSSAHLAPLQGSINVTIPLAQHSMVETGQVDDSGNSSVAVQDSNGQDAHNIPQPLPLDNHDGMDDESDDATDDDDDDEVDDEVSLTMGHAHEQHASQIGIGHAMEADSLVQCQVVRNTLQQQQQPMMPMDSSQMQQQCLQQKQPNGPRHDHAGHNHSMNSLSMSMTDEFATQSSSGDNDPNSGFSVHGKMYFEGRVVLHLKQWTDSQTSDTNSVGIGSNGNVFSSCAEQQHQKGHLHGCAVCRLKSPASHENHRSQKEAHRHTVKGVLFTFEDCIIVELYPEPPPSNPAETKIPPPPPAAQPEPPQQKEHPMPIASYMSPSVPIETHQEQAKKFLHHLDVNCLPNNVAMQNQNETEKHPVTVPQPQTAEDHGWWDECEFNDDLKRGDTDDDQDDNSPRTDTSCIANLKLHNQGSQEEPDGDCEFKIKPKCPHCSQSFMTTSELQSHLCRTHSVMLLEEVDLSSSPNSVHVSSTNDNDSVTTLHSSEESQQSNVADPPVQPVNKLAARKTLPTSKNVKLRHQCPVCDKAFHVKRLLLQHLEEFHADGNPFRCTRCNQQFTEEKRIRKHTCHPKHLIDQEKRSVPFEKIFSKALPQITADVSESNSVCSGDDRMSSDEDEEHSENADIKCLRLTGRKISSLQDTPEKSSSGQENHDNVAENITQGEERKLSRFTIDKKKGRNEKPFKCDVCGKRFTVERRLQNHKISHSAERSSQCEKCGKRFVRKDKLMRHMYVHSEEKLFSCEICQKRFSRRDKLSDHSKSHGGADEIHNCPMCQKQFLRPDILKQHVKLHTMGNKHQCSECLRFVTGKDRLEKHMARHKEAKALGQTLLCPLCTKYFIQKQSLKAHIKKFHPDANINLDVPDSELLPQHDQLQSQPNHQEIDLDSNGTGKRSQCSTTKTKPFECSHCKKQFAKKQALKKHMRKHQVSHSKSTDDSFVTSPSPDDDCLRMHLPSSTPPADTILAVTVAGSSPSPSPAHSILPTTHPPTPPVNIINSNSPSSNLSAAPPAHIPLLQQNITSTQCSHLQNASHGNHTQHHLPHHHLLPHGGHSTQGAQIPPMAHPSGQLHTSLDQHVSVPMQHHVSIATQQSMCGSSYVLAYPHYSYQ